MSGLHRATSPIKRHLSTEDCQELFLLAGAQRKDILMSVENVHPSRGRSFFVNQNFVMIWIGGTIARLSEGLLLGAFGLWIISSLAPGSSTSAVAIKGV